MLDWSHMMKRYLKDQVVRDLAKKMVFVDGPRQVGKTKMSLDILGGNEEHPAYLNWDVPGVAVNLQKGYLPGKQTLLVLDEIHKYTEWRNLVKGMFDRHRRKIQFLITGSARLDYYHHGGDSLQGRYHYLRLHPLSLCELGSFHKNDLEQLLQFGGFLEPFLEGEVSSWRRWQQERKTRVVHEDLLSLEKVQEVSKINLLVDHLPLKVSSPLSIQSLMGDLSAAHKSVAKWLDILQNLYFIFRIAPYGPPHVRAVKKEQKLYLWDWSLCTEEGPKFENLVASNLLKYCHFRQDTQGHSMELRYLRDTDKREIDFVVLEDAKPIFAVECIVKSKSLSPHIKYFSERTHIPIFYQVNKDDHDFEVPDYRARIIPFTEFARDILKI